MEAAARAGISLRHFERLVAQGLGPPIVVLGARRRGVIDDDNDQWIASRRTIPPGYAAPVAQPARTTADAVAKTTTSRNTLSNVTRHG
jgi:hypothetical protein